MQGDSTFIIPRWPVELPMSVEGFFSRLLGASAMRRQGWKLTESGWHKLCKKLTRQLTAYVEANITTDRQHGEEIKAVLLEMEKVPPDAHDVRLCALLIRLCLLLLGGLPNHRSARVTRGNKAYELNQFRSVQYSQSARQRAALIVLACYADRLYQYPPDEEAEAMAKLARRNPAELVEQFRNTQSGNYVALFS